MQQSAARESMSIFRRLRAYNGRMCCKMCCHTSKASLIRAWDRRPTNSKRKTLRSHRTGVVV